MDDKQYNQLHNFLVLAGFTILLMNFYVYCNPYLSNMGLTSLFVNKIFVSLSKLGMFASPWLTKLGALSAILMSALLVTVKLKRGGNQSLGFGIFVISLLIFLVAELLSKVMFDNWELVYMITSSLSLTVVLYSFIYLRSTFAPNLLDDLFNEENESFPQEERLLQNPSSVNLRTKYYHRGKWRMGWINIINPFRSTMVCGTPGSGKTFAVINSIIRQHIEKGFSMFIYDFKYPDLGKLAYNHFIRHKSAYKVEPGFYFINFDDPLRTHRCNPIDPEYMTEMADAYESAYTIMLNLNKTWTQKQGDFFVESPIILLAAIIWYLKSYQGGKYCTFPHAIELLNQPYTKVFPILMAREDLANYLSPFVEALDAGAQDQLQGQIASAKIPLSRIISPTLYWVMSANDFTLDLNNTEKPKILVIGNNPERQNIYGAALGLITGRMFKIINKKGRLPLSVIIDEAPTIYIKGIDIIINTARSNKVAVTLGLQDFSQLIRDYGKNEADVVINTVGNMISGQVVGDTARILSQRFGKIKQEGESMSINAKDVSSSYSTRMGEIIPPGRISNLSQGQFVGSVVDDFGQAIPHKIFNAHIQIDVDAVKREEKTYIDIPIINDKFTGMTEDDRRKDMERIIMQNYRDIKEDVSNIIDMETQKLKNATDPILTKAWEYYTKFNK